MSPWRVTLCVKLIELLVQARPRALRRTLFHPDKQLRHGMRWYARMGRRVWFHEWLIFFFRDRRVKNGPTLRAFWGEPQDHAEVPLRIVRKPSEPPANPRRIALSRVAG